MGPIGHVGLALATSVSSWLNVLILWVMLRKKIGPFFPLDKTLAVSALLSLGIGAAAYAVSSHAVLSLVLIAPLAVGYLGASALLGVAEARMLTALAARLIPKRFRKTPS